MGVSIYPVIEGRDDWSTGISGKALARHQDAIWKKIKKSGVRELYDFYVPDEGDLEEFGLEESSEEDSWYNPADGLATIAAMRQYVEANRDQFERCSELLRDLSDFHDLLDKGAGEGRRWHLGMDY